MVNNNFKTPKYNEKLQLFFVHKYQSLDICAYSNILPTDVYFISELCNLPWIASNYGGTDVFYNKAFLDCRVLPVMQPAGGNTEF